MNPLKQFKVWIIGETLLRNDDVFETARLNVLYNFTVFFIITTIPYVIVSFSVSIFHQFLGLFQLILFLLVLVIIKRTNNITTAVYFLLINLTFQNLLHFILGNGKIESVGILFFSLYVFFGFLLLGKAWGFGMTLVVAILYLTGLYNIQHDLMIWKVPKKYLDPESTQSAGLMTLLPFLLNVYLISQFVNARKKAELQINTQKIKLEASHKELEVKNKDITDSIHYAERIQRSFLASKEVLNKYLDEYFVFFKPKDVVSGDFYWASILHNGNFALVTADSTGHGVPGAIMSILNITCLEKSVEEEKLSEPKDILNHARINIIKRLKQDGSIEGGKDGMDCSIISFDKNNSKLTCSGANNPIWIVRKMELIELHPDKMPVGKHDKDSHSFTQKEILLQCGDVIYTLTDGYPDQFGGPKGKKFLYKKLKELLILISTKPMAEQYEVLSK
ncbi:MAG: PP2C family protein-serine/threonine phosphatase, partial [Bacteroidia bacterium]